MNKYIAVAVALVVVGYAFLGDLTPNTLESREPLTLSLPALLNPSIDNPAIGLKAWGVFTQYREFAKGHNIEGVRGLSHQTSETCRNPEKIEECNNLMDSVYFFTEAFKQEDFTNLAYDNRQVVLSTNYMVVEEAGDLVKVVLYFTRSGENVKVLGVRFCLKSEKDSDQCVETDPGERDLDKNGWWDDVEALFYR